MRFETEGLRYRTGAFSLDMGFTLESGEFGVVLGPSGCGKTTFLRIVAGLLPADSGSIRLGGRDIGSMPPERRNIGFVFQDFALFPHLNVRRNIEYGPGRRNMPGPERRRIAREMAELFRIGSLMERRPATLSGGEQQRVALARALAVRPDLVLLDEPLSSVDDTLRRDMRAMMRDRFSALGVTAIYVTHDIDEAYTLADRIILLRGGRVHRMGKPAAIFSDPQDEYCARFLSSGPLVPVLGGSGFPGNAESGYPTPFGTLRTAPSTGDRRPGWIYFPRSRCLSAGNAGSPSLVLPGHAAGPETERRPYNTLAGHVVSLSFSNGRIQVGLAAGHAAGGRQDPPGEACVISLEAPPDAPVAPGDRLVFTVPVEACRALPAPA